jgi:hypothetical protein
VGTLRHLNLHVFTELETRRQKHAERWLTAALLGSVKYAREPVVVILTDENGTELGRMSWGVISDELRASVDAQFPTPGE